MSSSFQDDDSRRRRRGQTTGYDVNFSDYDDVGIGKDVRIVQEAPPSFLIIDFG